MFLFLLIQQIVCDLPIFSSSFVNPTTQWQKNPNVEYVDCPQLTNQKCATITKKTYANEGLMSTDIPIDHTQDLTIEFKYLTKSQYERGLYSNLVNGFTNPLKSGYCFGATGLPSTNPLLDTITQRNKTGYLCPDFIPVVIQDLGDSWKTIKYTIPANQLSYTHIKIVFLDHLLFADEIYNNLPGAYYITDVVVSYAGKCSNGCSECSTFYDCSACVDGYHYLDGKCYQVSCANSLTNNVPYGKVTLTENQYSEYYSASIQIPGYIFERCWPAQWVTLEAGTGKFTELTVTTNQDIASISIESKNILNYGCSELGGNKFKCNFYFNVHFNEQTMYSQNYTQQIDFTASSVVPASFSGLVNPPALSIVIETDIFYCYRNLNDDDCWTNSGLTLVLNQNFKIKLIIKDQNLKNWNLEPGTIKLSGNGTLVNLKISNYTIPEPGTIIYLTSLCIKGYDGVNIVATVQATNPLNQNRLLFKSNNPFRLLNQERQLEPYNGNNVLGVAKITNLTIKSRQLIIEENPEWSGILIYGILMILLII